MLSFDVIIWCYHLFYVIIWCYHFSLFGNVFIFVLSFSLVQDGCYHFCYHSMLSFFVIISPLFSFSWKRDTLQKHWKISSGWPVLNFCRLGNIMLYRMHFLCYLKHDILLDRYIFLLNIHKGLRSSERRQKPSRRTIFSGLFISLLWNIKKSRFSSESESGSSNSSGSGFNAVPDSHTGLYASSLKINICLN